MLRCVAHTALLVTLLATVTGCPPTNSKPCDTDADCGSDGRCRRGACGPICVDDTECGTEQVCRTGGCVPAPECKADNDCATGFACKSDKCRCTNDSACAANQLCDDGACIARPRCTTDADCAALGRKCEVTQGLCIPACTTPYDCAPGVDPRVALALYNCLEGSCRRRCINDQTCGPGLICGGDGLCSAVECRTMSDCPSGEYCTSATTGRCETFTTCTTDAQCSPNFQCRAFGQNNCPPGFPCSQNICQELPRCFTDNDCQATFPGQQPGEVSFCSDQHCQPTQPCNATVACPTGKTCVAQTCVPAVCRGHGDCASGQVCVDGACKTPPSNADVAAIRISPLRAWVVASSTVKFSVVGYELSNASSPLSNVTWEVLDSGGAPSTAATVNAQGVVTGVSAATVRIKASLPGGSANPAEAQLTVIAAPSTGRAVVVVDSATRAPLTGVNVTGCDDPPDAGACTAATTVQTDATGVAAFPGFTGARATFDIASPATRTGDGLPAYERASLIDVTGNVLLVPLEPNPVHGNAGFTANITFTSVHTVGNYWAGFAVTSLQNPIDSDLTQLLGEPFMTTVPGVQQRFPVPGAVVAYTSIGFGIPNEVKGTSYGLSQAGRRHAIAFAGKAQQDQLFTLRSTDVLAYTGAMDYALQSFVSPPHHARVADTLDLDQDGLCSNAQQCPGGSEDLPDYAKFARLSLTPARTQERRTEVVIPNLPASLDTVVVSAVETDSETGLMPLGLSSRTAGAPSGDGSRPVTPVLLRSGAPYGGIELGSPGIWALAISLNGQGAQDPGGRTSARITKGTSIPTRVVMKPFLPFVEGSTLTPSAFAPGQPSWNAVTSAGADLARIVIVGSTNRRVIYVPMTGSASSIRLPDRATGAGVDPLTEAMTRVEVQPCDLAGTTSAQDALDAQGVNLLDLPTILDGYSRSAQ